MAYPPDSIYAICVILPLIALIAICLRFWVRLRVQPSHLGLDDWFILVSMVLLVGDAIILSLGAYKGIQGRIFPDEIPENRKLYEAKIDYAQVVIEKPLYGLVKLSVLFFFRRIFLVHKEFRIFNTVMIIFIAAWTVAFFFAEVFVCGTQPQVKWTAGAVKHCVDETALDMAFAVTDTFGDILIVLMPYPVIRKLQIGTREKLGLVGIFLLGTLSTVASIVRLAFIIEASYSDFGNGSNKQASGTPPAVWSLIEPCIGILAACLPPLGPLIRRAPNPRKASVTLYHKFFTKSSRKASFETIRLGKLDSDAERLTAQQGQV